MSKRKYVLNNNYAKTDIENVISEWIIGTSAVRNREILRLRLIDGYTYESIAEKVDVSDNTVKNTIHSLLPIIQKELDRKSV